LLTIATIAGLVLMFYVIHKINVFLSIIEKLQQRVRYLGAEVNTLNKFIRRAPSLKNDLAQFEERPYILKEGLLEFGIGSDFTSAYVDMLNFYDWKEQLHGADDYIDDGPPDDGIHFNNLIGKVRAVVTRLNQLVPESVTPDHVAWLGQQKDSMDVGRYLRWLTPHLLRESESSLYSFPDEAKAEVEKLKVLFSKRA